MLIPKQQMDICPDVFNPVNIRSLKMSNDVASAHREFTKVPAPISLQGATTPSFRRSASLHKSKPAGTWKTCYFAIFIAGKSLPPKLLHFLQQAGLFVKDL